MLHSKNMQTTYSIQSIKTIKLMLIRKKRRKNGKKNLAQRTVKERVFISIKE